MKKIFPFLVCSLPVFILLFCTASTSKEHKKVAAKNSFKNFVVLELFTSQGCSSCSAADRLLGKYADKENVIALSFHVDYWNRLGWKDPFSSAAFSKRQENYVNKLNASGVYTPQVFINGEKEMVGSDENQMAAAVRTYQSAEPKSIINIEQVKSENGKVNITYTISSSEKYLLNFALVQNKIATSIKAGENSGLQLTNYNVVRNFKTLQSSEGTNTVSIDLLSGEEKANFSIILYTQNTQTYNISGAAKANL